MLKVIVPNNNIPERQYIVDVLLTEFLGLEYALETSDNQNDWSIFLDNGSSIVIRDAFFSRHKEPLSYLAEKNVPSNVEFCALKFSPEQDMPVLFGKGALSVSESSIACEVDIFAGAFFMLTRWEEYVNKARDAHDRFPAAESVAYKHGFLDRPIVNEYVEFLWNLLVQLGFQGVRKKRLFNIVPTHDVDSTFYWRDWRFILKTLAGDLVKRKAIKKFASSLIEVIQVGLGFRKDPFDTFDMLMHLSDTHGVKSSFYFMAGGNSKFDNAYAIKSRKTKRLISKIRRKGHGIGIHPSYNTYLDREMLAAEKAALELIADLTITSGRQHVLRYDVSVTPQLWDEVDLKEDSTLGYAEFNGFRAGTCFSYKMFSFLERKALFLVQRPLVYMEVTDFKYRKLALEDAEVNLEKLIFRVKKYQGDFVFLWHNSNIQRSEWYERFNLLIREKIYGAS